MKNILNTINTPKDLKNLSIDELQQLAHELRAFIINIVATKEGHLGASLGVVELTIAIHYIFNTPKDKLIWDVGHQAYGHKILTGRRTIFDTNRRLNGISGFPNIFESEYDAFGTGHSSTSISAALGMAMAAKIQGDTKQQHIAVIGDASIASGMAFEALNHAGVTNANLLVILNDNAIGIDPSIGALKDYLTQTKNGKELNRDNIFEALNFDYSGPIDGHDLPKVISELKRLQNVEGPKFLHIVTTKGKGLKKAEEDQITYHAPGKFNAETGDRIKSTDHITPPKYQDIFGHTIIELAKKNPKIVGITPAMPTGSSLKYMIAEMPERAFDVGIAEQHAVTLAAGMAKQGLVPFCNIYSTFLQRAYDQVIHDVAIQKLPVIFCLDRAGLVGNDGATHHGIFDIAYLRCIPNMILYAPMNEIDLRNIMYTAQKGLSTPIAIRYPRGLSENVDWKQPFNDILIGKGRMLKEGNSTAVLSIGTIGNIVNFAICQFDEEGRDKVGHYNMQFIKPLDDKLLHKIFSSYKTIITYEDGSIQGGFGSAILEFAAQHNYHQKIMIKGVPDNFIEHGKTQELKAIVNIDEASIFNTILSTL
ncbi:1-deoxy-D-xylulose-5-phosphate synthase [Wenyingzhuangia marina]|uniref:1-deoxy-D-xylulose-5-phosphate synthase n=1 Tax=Wenyingzhuangia marina TaxID=1195760 RepID=A0A1M5SII0_9FLAO|nr:1-deoxy-D-xylulose-5-phosphate synthase [Wenyingzhuangia marina]GGF62393.1 1-deoxy-D-xylulose-5-phosphate synthase [Wenyingzhuangia marina]SHH38346.1 1-deoxy-D-xylulose-5-phosphate synthase [Wenyingzhuangia marina]